MRERQKLKFKYIDLTPVDFILTIRPRPIYYFKINGRHYHEEMTQMEKTYHNKNKGFVVGFDLNTKEALDRRKQRAKRFNLKKEEKISQRAKRFGIKEEEQVQLKKDPFSEILLKDISWPEVTEEALDEPRPEALLLYGVEHMSTKDVFSYFKDYGPDTMEWIDDVSYEVEDCDVETLNVRRSTSERNGVAAERVVVWEDEVAALKALNGISKTYDQLAAKIKSQERAEESTADVQENIPEDAKQTWRIAAPCENANALFLRQATKSDKKLPGAANRSKYYLMYGRGQGNRKGKQGLISSTRKRRLDQQQEIAKERYKSNNPEVQFMEVEQTAEDATKPDDAVERMDIDEETKEPIAKRVQLEMPREEKTKMHMSMYADKVEARKDGPGVFGRLGEDNEIKIEVTAHFEKNKKRNSGVNRRLDTDELSSESDDDEDDAIIKTSEGKLHRDNVLPREEPNETAEVEITVQDEDDILYVNEDFKVEETEKNDDLRNQLDSKDLRGLLKKKTTSDSDEDNKKGAVDLREKLRQRQNKKSFDPSKVNLCIEVTEVSEEEEEEEEEEF